MNQMANEGDLKITKGTTKTYTYKGDSGQYHYSSSADHLSLTKFISTCLMTRPHPYVLSH